jgi:hypothetical protein
MKQVLPNIWQWSWFSEEKKLDFNGLFLTIGEHRILVDPPPLTSEARTLLHQSGPVDYIVVTNRDHERETTAYRKEFGCQVMLPSVDAAQMSIKGDRTFKDGELLPGGIWVVQLKDQKSPGECALFLPQGKGILILGDAMIGKPPGSLSLLPAEKYADAGKAREGLHRLLKYHFDAVLCGDGAAILSGGKQAVERALAQ